MVAVRERQCCYQIALIALKKATRNNNNNNNKHSLAQPLIVQYQYEPYCGDPSFILLSMFTPMLCYGQGYTYRYIIFSYFLLILRLKLKFSNTVNIKDYDKHVIKKVGFENTVLCEVMLSLEKEKLKSKMFFELCRLKSFVLVSYTYLLSTERIQKEAQLFLQTFFDS